MMIEQRKRNSIYYLERISGPVLMHEDGSVARLDKKLVDVTERLPSRVAGRERIKHTTINRLGEVALFDSLAECLADQKKNISARMPFGYEDTSWTLEDMPAPTLKEFQEWCDQPLMDIEAVRQVAVERSADWSKRQDERVACMDCTTTGGGAKYACRTCGYSRQFYAYPVVQYHGNNATHDIPMDVASLVQLRPDTLSLVVKPYFSSHGMMTAERVLRFDARLLPEGYVPHLGAKDELEVNMAEELARPIDIVIEHWTESEARHRMPERARSLAHGPDEFAKSRGFLTSSESCMAALQTHVTQRLYHERYDTDQAAARLDALRKKLGAHGLGLAYEYAYAGMGESDAKFMLARRHNDYVDVQPITHDIDVQYGIETAFKFVDQHLVEPSR